MPDNEQLYFNGDIHTVDDSRPEADAVAVKNGIISAVGSIEECESCLSGDCEKIDLEGKALLPGFIDVHLHPVVMVFYEMNVDLGGVVSLDRMRVKLREASEKLPPGEWVVGLNFDEHSMDDPTLPTRHDLDKACPDRPAIVLRHDAHLVVANTKVIEAIGISADTPDPEAGVIEREPDGRPSGIFLETAAYAVLGAMPMPDVPLLVEGAKSVFNKLLSHGITSMGIVLQTDEEGPAGAAGKFDVLAMQLFLEHAPVNMYTLLIAEDLEKIDAARGTGLHTDIPGGNRVGGVKIYTDGSFGACTAYMNEPYADRPDTRGFPMHEPEELYRRMVEAQEKGLQVTLHAIGDAANRMCVDLFERLVKEHPIGEHRHRIEHASQLDEKTIADISRLGIVVATQPLFIHSEKHWLHKRLGVDRAKWTYPFRSLLDAGVKVAGASDAPIESTSVLDAIQCCVTREGFEPHQSITAAEAVRMFTIDAAYAQFEDDVKGSITPGKRADMVVLGENPVKINPEKIHEILVERTIVGGKTVYRR